LGNINVVTSNLGLSSHVVTAGTTSSGSTAATLSGLDAGATVELGAAGTFTVDLLTDSGSSDVINLVIKSDGTLDVLDVVTTNIETVNLSAVDTFVDVTGGKDAFGTNIADGKDDTNSVQNIDINSDTTTAMNVTGDADLTINIDNAGGTSTLATVDANAFTGKLTVTLDGATAGTTITGGSGDDTFVASGAGDVIKGGAGADTITLTNTTTATGGAGNDTFIFATTATATTYSTITDLSAGDVISTTGAVADNFVSTMVTGTAMSTFANMLDAAIVAAADLGDATLDDAMAYFQFGGNTYLVTDSDTQTADTFQSTDSVLEITGLVDLSAASFNTLTGELTIV
jgi:hypothetical protein